MKKTIIIFFIVFLFLPKYNSSQKPSSYKMEFVRSCADSTEKGKHIMAVFSVIPNVKKFKLILSMKVTYQLQKGPEIISVLKQNEDNIKIVVYGKNLEGNKPLYDFIKDKINLNTEEDLRLIVFYFNNITKENADEMSITYGLWESNNTNIRNEKKYDFNIEMCNSR